MYTEIFQQLGLSKNGARIYETLLREGELSVGQISVKSGVHRRNVYDAIQRLLEQGLVFEILERKENRYQAVDPNKLRELIQEKERSLVSVLPDLQKLYEENPREQAVYIYRGIEGWKNYMRDIIRVGEDFYCIGGKGAWMEERIMNFFPQFINDAKRKKIKYFHLFDYEVKESGHDIIKHVGKNFKFLPKEYSTTASIDIFGDRVNMTSSVGLGTVDKDTVFNVIVNREVADACRAWFRFMWEFCPEVK